MRRTKSNLSKAPLDFAGNVAYNEGWAAFYLNHGINTNTPVVVDWVCHLYRRGGGA